MKSNTANLRQSRPPKSANGNESYPTNGLLNGAAKKEYEILRDLLFDGTKGRWPRRIDDLLAEAANKAVNKAAKGAKISQQAAAIELWDLLQWGHLELTADGHITKAGEVDNDERPDDRPDLQRRRDMRDRKEHASGVRRSEGRIDRDRIIQSFAFRRLEGVTQIVTPDQSGHLMHSRLTHSLKVGQVGRRIADELIERQKQGEIADGVFDKGGGLDPEVVEAAGLAHDIGHPPFGHAGEKVLDEWARSKGVPDGFEGNAQSLRVLTRQEARFAHKGGMNLTNATKAAIVKYPWARDTDATAGSTKFKKFNAYRDDLKKLERARRALGVGGEVQTLEASIMDIADDITYALHDVEDFYTAGLFPRNHIINVLEDYAEQRKPARKDPTTNQYLRKAPMTNQYLDLNKYAKDLAKNPPFDSGRFDKAVERVRILIQYSMYRQFDGTRDAFALIRTAFATRIDAYIRNIGIPVDGPAVAKLNADHWYEIQVLKWLTRTFIRDRSELAITQLGQARLLWQTLDRLFKWCSEESTDLKLPPALKELTRTGTDNQARARGIVDYVASLTDAQLASLATALSAAGPPSSLYFV
jgi:dGTPase